MSVPVISAAHAATIHDISLRTHYTWGSHSEMARKLLIASSHTGAGARQDRRNAMRASAFDPPAIPAAFWERPDVCQALRTRDMGALFCAAVPVHRAQPDAHRHRGRPRPGPHQRSHQRHPGHPSHSRLPAHSRWPRHARPRPDPARPVSPPDHGQPSLARHHPGQAGPGHRVAPADHRRPQDGRNRRPRPSGRNGQYPAPGPPPRRPCPCRKTGSPHQPYRRRAAVLSAARQS